MSRIHLHNCCPQVDYQNNLDHTCKVSRCCCFKTFLWFVCVLFMYFFVICNFFGMQVRIWRSGQQPTVSSAWKRLELVDMDKYILDFTWVAELQSSDSRRRKKPHGIMNGTCTKCCDIVPSCNTLLLIDLVRNLLYVYIS